jgi:hypothetical protein
MIFFSSQSRAAFQVASLPGVTSTICRSTLSITRRMVSNGIPPSGSVIATFVGMSSPRSLASRASSLMSASGGSDRISARLVPEQHSDRLQAGELCFARPDRPPAWGSAPAPGQPSAKHRWRLQCRSQPPKT